jgi:hypothetical protein
MAIPSYEQASSAMPACQCTPHRVTILSSRPRRYTPRHSTPHHIAPLPALFIVTLFVVHSSLPTGLLTSLILLISNSKVSGRCTAVSPMRSRQPASASQNVEQRHKEWNTMSAPLSILSYTEERVWRRGGPLAHLFLGVVIPLQRG